MLINGFCYYQTGISVTRASINYMQDRNRIWEDDRKLSMCNWMESRIDGKWDTVGGTDGSRNRIRSHFYHKITQGSILLGCFLFVCLEFFIDASFQFVNYQVRFVTKITKCILKRWKGISSLSKNDVSLLFAALQKSCPY